MRSGRIAFALFLLAATGCAASTSAPPRLNAPITQEELQQSRASTVLAAVRELRPHWMNRLSGGFVGGEPVSAERLQLEPLGAIAEIRLLSAEQATARYGTRTLSGTFLEVVLRR